MSIANKILSYLGKVSSALRKTKVVSEIRVVSPDKVLSNKNAFITGGSGGIGMAIAKSFTDAGANVVIAGTNQDKLNTCIKELGENSKSIILDITDVESFEDKITDVENLFASNKIDILVNCAGLINKNDFFHMSESEYDSIMDINAKGTYFVCQTVAKHMIKQSTKGHILNVSSSSALRPAKTPYETSKWFIRGFTLGLADLLLPYGIVVNAIGPGPTATSMLGISEDDLYREGLSGRHVMPSEIGDLAVIMASTKGDMIVGDTYYITGGSGIISMDH